MHRNQSGVDGPSRSRACRFHASHGSLTAQRSSDAHISACVGLAFRLGGRRRHPGVVCFAARIPRTHLCQRLTFSLAADRARLGRQDGSLCPSCVTPSFTTPAGWPIIPTRPPTTSSPRLLGFPDFCAPWCETAVQERFAPLQLRHDGSRSAGGHRGAAGFGNKGAIFIS